MSPEILLSPFPQIKIQSWKKRKFISLSPKKIQKTKDFVFSNPISQAKPFVKWVGGKRQLLKQFQNFYPKDFNPITNTYFEPFVGGGAVFFNLHPYKATLSDINEELIATYQTIKEAPEKLIKELKKYKYEKEFYLEIRAQDPKKLSKVKVASRFLFLNRTGFNGLYRVNSKGGFNVPFGRYTNPIICDEANIQNVSQLLQNVEIKNRSYKEVLKDAKKGDFIYFDPPYIPLNPTSSFTSYTQDGFGKKQQEELRDVFVKLHKKGCFVMLSNSDTPVTRELYKDFTINTVFAGRMVNANAKKRGKVQEVVVCNY